MNGTLSHVMLWARDLDSAVGWYGSVLGFQVTYHAPGEYAALHHGAMGGIALHRAGPEDSEQIGRGPMPYYGVADLDATVAWLVDRGVAVHPIQQVSESPRQTWFEDCEGNLLGLEEQR